MDSHSFVYLLLQVHAALCIKANSISPSHQLSLEGLPKPVLVLLSPPHSGSSVPGVTHPQGGRTSACSSCKDGAAGAELVPWGGERPLPPQPQHSQASPETLQLEDRVRSGPGSVRTVHSRRPSYLSDDLSKAVSIRGPGHTCLATFKGKQGQGVG